MFSATTSIDSSRSSYAPSSSSQKDFASALANLRSTYGSQGSVPIIPASKKPSKSKDARSKRDTLRGDAFGDLQATYGFVGGLGEYFVSYVSDQYLTQTFLAPTPTVQLRG